MWQTSAQHDAEKLRVALFSLLAGMAVATLKTLAWVESSSVAVLADALHSTVDILAVFLTYLAIRAAMKPPDVEHPYGHHKAETLGGIGGSLAVMASVIFIMYEAVRKVVHWEFYTPTLASLVMLTIAVAIDANRVMVLRRYRGLSRALEADSLHFTSDLVSSTVVLSLLIFGALAAFHAPALFMQWGPVVDVIAASSIAVYFSYLSLRLLKTSVVELLDFAPPEVVQRAFAKASEIEGVTSVKSVKLRKSGGIYHAEVVITTEGDLSLREAHQIADRVEEALRKELRGEVTVHVEPTPRRDSSESPSQSPQ